MRRPGPFAPTHSASEFCYFSDDVRDYLPGIINGRLLTLRFSCWLYHCFVVNSGYNIPWIIWSGERVLQTLWAIEFAGGNCRTSQLGCQRLVLACVLGSANLRNYGLPCHNTPFVLLGAAFLVRWFGFNGAARAEPIIWRYTIL